MGQWISDNGWILAGVCFGVAYVCGTIIKIIERHEKEEK